MSFYRSDPISHYQLILPRENSWALLNQLGKRRLMHVIPSKNTTEVKPFTHVTKRCDQLLIKIKQILCELRDKNMAMSRTQLSKQEYLKLYEVWEDHQNVEGNYSRSYLDHVDEEITKISKYCGALKKRKEQTEQRVAFYKENIAIVGAGEKLYGPAFYSLADSEEGPVNYSSMFETSKFRFRALVVDTQDLFKIQKAVYRITRNNTLINQVPYSEIFVPQPGVDLSNKTVMFIFYPSSKEKQLDRKITKLIEQYCKNEPKYVLPYGMTEANFRNKMAQVHRTYIQSQNLNAMTEQQITKYLGEYLTVFPGLQLHRIDYYMMYVLKERDIHHALNQMRLYNHFVEGNIYLRDDDIEAFSTALNSSRTDSDMPSGQIFKKKNKSLPTNFVVNDYTRSAQQIVQTYGVAQYQQANPSFFTTVTFPFLFGVMFGDIAHGLILFCFGVYLMFQSDHDTNSLRKILHPHRYLIALMGFFATYCGFVYNDFMSLSLNLFGSCYMPLQATQQQPIPRSSDSCVYPFGLDPVWAVASNNLNFVNSLKMKISVIIAVVHMILGVFVKASNALYFKKTMDFVFQFVPQLLFMTLLFGYMDFLIIYKWLKPWPLYAADAPSIITTMINLPLRLGKTDDCCGGQPMWGTYPQSSQDDIQLVFLMISVLCIPLMLFPKPLYQIWCKKHANEPNRQYRPIGESDYVNNEESFMESAGNSMKAADAEEEHDASEIFVHQMIETIEYVLGCISNTASYLRLWALSLAHSQLSEVFFQKSIETGIVENIKGIPIMVIGFPILAGVTFGVLLCMDSMQCFLHTLRLHWVQFQNKFYKGDGFPFTPLSFADSIRDHIQQK